MPERYRFGCGVNSAWVSQCIERFPTSPERKPPLSHDSRRKWWPSAREIPEGVDTPFRLRRGSETHAEVPVRPGRVSPLGREVQQARCLLPVDPRRKGQPPRRAANLHQLRQIQQRNFGTGSLAAEPATADLRLAPRVRSLTAIRQTCLAGDHNV